MWHERIAMYRRLLESIVFSIIFIAGCGRQNDRPAEPAAKGMNDLVQTPGGMHEPEAVDLPRGGAAPAPPAANSTSDQGQPLGEMHQAEEVDAPPASTAPPAELAEFRATVERAFESLRKQGIVAEAKFEDCARCAVVAMTDLLEEQDSPGGVYWHDQDDERLEQGEDLAVGFVARGDGDAAAIGQALVAALQAENLNVEWDGSPDKRVVVTVPWNQSR
jgi:hypothetical protein